MAELADAADLKSAAFKRGVGVRVPLSAPSYLGANHSRDLSLLLEEYLKLPLSNSSIFLCILLGFLPFAVPVGYASADATASYLRRGKDESSKVVIANRTV